MEVHDRVLLLLPVPNLFRGNEQFRRSHRQTEREILDIVLSRLRPRNPEDVAILDIAIVLGQIDDALRTSRSELYKYIQPILEEVYTNVCATAALRGIDLDLPGGIDVRAFFVYAQEGQQQIVDDQLSGPLVDLPTFVGSDRQYNGGILCPSSEQGRTTKEMFENCYAILGKASPGITMINEGVSNASKVTDDKRSHDASITNNVHHRVIVGGTFDHIHIGHKLLLTATVYTSSPVASKDSQSIPREITVGITSSTLLENKKHASVLESWETRQQRCAEFVESMLVLHPDPASIRRTDYINEPGPNGRVVKVTYTLPSGQSVSIKYTDIWDPFGPTITDESLTAIVISAETRAGGKAVNDKRKEKGWKELDVVEVGVLDTGSGDEGNAGSVKGFESKISSTEIRRRLVEKGLTQKI